MSTAGDREWEIIHTQIARLRASVMAVVFGMCGGVGLFVATVWLVAKGSPEGHGVGPTLSLLGHYFPGYDVSWTGAFLGLLYGGATGAILGGLLAWLYNMFAGTPRQS